MRYTKSYFGVLFSICIGLYGGLACADLQTSLVEVPGQGDLSIGVYDSVHEVRSDILFFHGHADRLSNHEKTFSRWSEEGYRVLSFDLPQHGQSQLGPLDRYSMDDLIGLAITLERATREEADRPLILAGWSLGGLLVTRLVQSDSLREQLQRPVAGMLLITPGVAVQPFTGGDGIARLATLTRNENLVDIEPPSPASPLTTPLFAVRLLKAAWESRQALLPQDIPAAIIVADEKDDWYVDTKSIKAWSLRQKQFDRPVAVWQCQGARHALELEPYPTSHWLLEYTSVYFSTLVQNNQTAFPITADWDAAFASSCHSVSS